MNPLSLQGETLFLTNLSNAVDRRLDEWVTAESFDLAHIEPPGARVVHKEEKHVDKEDRKITRNYKRKHEDPHHSHGDHVNVSLVVRLKKFLLLASYSVRNRRRTLPRRNTNRSRK